MNTAADGHRDEADHDEELAREGSLARGVDDPVDAQEREERAVRHAAGEERADDPGRLAVGVGLPGVQRREAHLRAVADEQEDEGGAEPRARELRRAARRAPRRGAMGSPPPMQAA